MKKQYVISIKRVTDFLNRVLPEEEQYWQYAQLDCHAGSFSSGYPVFGDEFHAKKFESIDEAKEWWESHERYLSYQFADNGDKYNYSTLAIRQHISIYRTITKL